MLGFHRVFDRAWIIVAAFSLAVVTLLIVPPLYAKTWNVPADFATIQEAIEGAAAGDTIKIKGGKPYDECLTVDKSLTLLGIRHGKKRKRATIKAYDCGGPAITIASGVTGVEINGLNIRLSLEEGVKGEGGNDGTSVKNCYIVSNFGMGINIEGDNVDVKSCRVMGNRLGGVKVKGDGCEVSQVRCMGSDAFGIKVMGNNNRIQNNKSLRNNGAGITVSGDYNVVEDNMIKANSGHGIVFTGSLGNIVRTNTVRSNDGTAIKFPADSNFNDIYRNKLRSGPGYGIIFESGEYNAIDKNFIKSFGMGGIGIIGSNKSIRKNTIDSIYNGWGISCEGDVNAVTENEVTDCSSTGIVFAGGGSIVSRNTVQSCIIDPDANAISVAGGGNVIERNVCSEVSNNVIDVIGDSNHVWRNETSLSFGGAGVYVVGDGNDVWDNYSTENTKDGFRIVGDDNYIADCFSEYNGHFGEHGFDIDGSGNTIEDNDASNNIGDGINVFGDDNIISHNDASENGIDGIDVDGDFGDGSSTSASGGNEITNNFALLNTAEGIENNALSGAGCLSGRGTLIANNESRFNGLCDFAISRRNPGDPLCAAVAPGSDTNISGDGTENLECIPVIDSW